MIVVICKTFLVVSIIYILWFRIEAWMEKCRPSNKKPLFSGTTRVVHYLFKRIHTKTCFSDFVEFNIKFSLVILSFFLFPYFDKNIIPTSSIISSSFYEDFNFGLFIVFYTAVSFVMFISSQDVEGQNNRKETAVATLILLYTFTQLGMMYNYGTMSFQEVIVNQGISSIVFLPSLGLIKNPILFLISTTICIFLYKEIRMESSIGEISSLTKKHKNVLNHLFGELLFVGLALSFVYLYLGGHLVPWGDTIVSKINPWFHAALQIVVIVLKATALILFFSSVAKVITQRSEYFKNKLAMSVIFPLILFGIVMMPILQYWSNR